nr:hypothetical protein [Endozoicomonas sp.]
MSDWKEAAKKILHRLDNGVDETRDESDDSRTTFIKKFLLRKAILNEFGLILSTLNEELGESRNFIYDSCIARIIHQIALEFNDDSDNTPLTEDKLTMMFKRAARSISDHINDAQDSFARSLVECYSDSSKINADQSVSAQSSYDNPVPIQDSTFLTHDFSF